LHLLGKYSPLEPHLQPFCSSSAFYSYSNLDVAASLKLVLEELIIQSEFHNPLPVGVLRPQSAVRSTPLALWMTIYGIHSALE
jgi:hypothetical protein